MRCCSAFGALVLTHTHAAAVGATASATVHGALGADLQATWANGPWGGFQGNCKDSKGTVSLVAGKGVTVYTCSNSASCTFTLTCAMSPIIPYTLQAQYAHNGGYGCDKDYPNSTYTADAVSSGCSTVPVAGVGGSRGSCCWVPPSPPPTPELVPVDVWADYYAHRAPNGKATCFTGPPPRPANETICKDSHVDAWGQIEVIHQYEDGRPHNRDYIPAASARFPNIGPVTNYDVVKTGTWRCFSDVNKTCAQASTWPPQAVPPHVDVPRISGALIPWGTSQHVAPGSQLAPPYAPCEQYPLGQWRPYQVHELIPDNCAEPRIMGTNYHRVWLGVADSFDFGGDIGIQTNVLVLDEEEWGGPDGVAPPAALGGGMRLERYLYPRGAWGRSAQLGAESHACRKAPTDAAACNGSYELDGGICYWNAAGTEPIASQPICPLNSSDQRA
jgi:hypothetical protein